MIIGDGRVLRRSRCLEHQRNYTITTVISTEGAFFGRSGEICCLTTKANARISLLHPHGLPQPNDLHRLYLRSGGTRLAEKNEVFDGFSKEYACHWLVYFEDYQTAVVAIARGKQLKRWSRAKKLALIDKVNPTWEDLSEAWGKRFEFRELKPVVEG